MTLFSSRVNLALPCLSIASLSLKSRVNVSVALWNAIGILTESVDLATHLQKMQLLLGIQVGHDDAAPKSWATHYLTGMRKLVRTKTLRGKSSVQAMCAEKSDRSDALERRSRLAQRSTFAAL